MYCERTFSHFVFRDSCLVRNLCGTQSEQAEARAIERQVTAQAVPVGRFAKRSWICMLPQDLRRGQKLGFLLDHCHGLSSPC